jgi:6-phosphogluconolactonase
LVADGIPRLDVLLLGMGEDGHTASLFPGTEALHETSRLVLGYTVEKLNAPRITLTFPVINNAGKVLFLVSGEGKAAILRELFQGESPELRYPAAMVAPRNGLLYWHLDREAASMIHVAVSE